MRFGRNAERREESSVVVVAACRSKPGKVRRMKFKKPCTLSVGPGRSMFLESCVVISISLLITSLGLYICERDAFI
jgi:hypothetical protein